MWVFIFKVIGEVLFEIYFILCICIILNKNLFYVNVLSILRKLFNVSY